MESFSFKQLDYFALSGLINGALSLFFHGKALRMILFYLVTFFQGVCRAEGTALISQS